MSCLKHGNVRRATFPPFPIGWVFPIRPCNVLRWFLLKAQENTVRRNPTTHMFPITISFVYPPLLI